MDFKNFRLIRILHEEREINVLDDFKKRLTTLSFHQFSELTENERQEVVSRLVLGVPFSNLKLSDSLSQYNEEFPTVEEALERIQLAELYLEEKNQVQSVSVYRRPRIWSNFCDLWLAYCGLEDFSLGLLNVFNHCTDSREVPGFWVSSNSEPVSILDTDFDAMTKLTYLFHQWFAHVHGSYDPLFVTWDAMKANALEHGLSAGPSEEYRTACEEAFEKTWDFNALLYLGLLDVPLIPGRSVSKLVAMGGSTTIREIVKDQSARALR
jgi:hypothetical protein